MSRIIKVGYNILSFLAKVLFIVAVCSGIVFVAMYLATRFVMLVLGA